MDIQDGFHSLEIDKEDSEISSFITPDFTMSFLRLPLGAKNSPALFCAVIGHVFRDFMVTRLPESIQEEVRFLFIYMDDLLCYSNNFEDHLTHLQRIFQRLRYADLVVNYKKCSFAAGEVELLGFLVGRHGIKVNPKKQRNKNSPFPGRLDKLNPC
jgi:hypothetical protein